MEASSQNIPATHRYRALDHEEIMILERVLNPSGVGLRDVLGMDGR